MEEIRFRLIFEPEISPESQSTNAPISFGEGAKRQPPSQTPREACNIQRVDVSIQRRRRFGKGAWWGGGERANVTPNFPVATGRGKDRIIEKKEDR